LAGCGGGDGDAGPNLTIGADFTTTLDRVTLSGTMSLPTGSERAGGTPAVPFVTCQLGPHSLAWSNAANAGSGNAYAPWDGPREFAFRTAAGIPLARGANRITVVLTDDVARAEAAITVTRE
jgi:hypothetical protein